VLLTQASLAQHVGVWGRPFVSIAIVLFAFTSVMYSYYLAENCLAHVGLGGRLPVFVFRVFSLAVVYWGTQQDLSTIFTMADLMMACLASVNLYALASLSGLGLRLLRDYERQQSEGRVEPELDPAQYSDLRLDQEAWKRG
jgi:AGCS family alanine or glycine:cation symporter